MLDRLIFWEIYWIVIDVDLLDRSDIHWLSYIDYYHWSLVLGLSASYCSGSILNQQRLFVKKKTIIPNRWRCSDPIFFPKNLTIFNSLNNLLSLTHFVNNVMFLLFVSIYIIYLINVCLCNFISHTRTHYNSFDCCRSTRADL